MSFWCLNFPKKRTKTIQLEVPLCNAVFLKSQNPRQAETLCSKVKKFRSFFRRIEDTKTTDL